MNKNSRSTLLNSNNSSLLVCLLFFLTAFLFFYPYEMKTESYILILITVGFNIIINIILLVKKINIKVYYFKKMLCIFIGLGFLIAITSKDRIDFDFILIKLLIFYNIASFFLGAFIYNEYCNLKISEWYTNAISLFQDKHWIDLDVKPDSNDFIFLSINGYFFNYQGLHYGNTIITIKELLNYQEENGLTFNQLTSYDFNVLEMIKI